MKEDPSSCSWIKKKMFAHETRRDVKDTTALDKA